MKVIAMLTYDGSFDVELDALADNIQQVSEATYVQVGLVMEGGKDELLDDIKRRMDAGQD